MATIASSPKARLCLLRTSGETVDALGEAATPEGQRNLVVSRGFCHHALFSPPAGLSRRLVVRAARMQAEAHCPFADGDWLLSPAANGVAIWWWDASRVRTAIGDRWAYDARRIVPETTLEPPGEGWRQMTTVDGFDMQYWSAGVLRSSHWRRHAFDAPAWNALAFGLAGAAPLPETIPEAVGLKLAEPARLPPAPPRDWGWADATRGALAASAAALLIASWFSGRAIAVDRATQAVTADAGAVFTTGAPAGHRIEARLATIRTIAAMSSRPDPLPALAAAFAVLDRSGATARSWRIDRDGVRIVVAAPGTGRAIAAGLERLPAFTEVHAMRDGKDAIAFEAALIVPASAAR